MRDEEDSAEERELGADEPGDSGEDSAWDSAQDGARDPAEPDPEGATDSAEQGSEQAQAPERGADSTAPPAAETADEASTEPPFSPPPPAPPDIPQETAPETSDEAAEADALSGEPDFLDEAYYPPTAQGSSLEPDSVQRWGELSFRVGSALPGGWHEAQLEDGGGAVLVQPGPHAAFWRNAPRHPLLPSVRYAGPEGLMVACEDAAALEPPLPPLDALGAALALAQLLRFFEAHGQAVLYLEPDGLQRLEGRLRLRYPPRLAPIGEALPTFYREGYTAPEVQTGASATGKEGVYALAALLSTLLTGRAPPPEGPNALEDALRLPGLPQLFARALEPAAERLGIKAFAGALRALRDDLARGRPTFRLGAATTVGLNPERPVNEDSYGFLQDTVESYAGHHGLLRACVADGMGGAAAGELASRAAVETFCRETPSRPLDSLTAQSEWTLHLGWSANRAVLEVLAGRDGGCTLTGVILIGARLTLVHVGDTRAYLVSANRMSENPMPENGVGNGAGCGLEPLTRDHSLVAALVANGLLSAEQARSSPDRSTILRSLGSLRQPQEGYLENLAVLRSGPSLELAAGDAVLLVSDGVWGEVDEASMAHLAQRYPDDPQALADALVAAALAAGAPDNATALVVQRSS